ncbi:MAG: sodium:calcium antiporter [Hymenobacteraceae bacterium]|nr:sodium:calcium antiporter [Hymenobacteraceae bacterium]
MFNLILLLLGSLILLVIGAEGLVRGATSLALRLGISTLVIGLTVVAFGTNSPELLVNARAAASGHAVVGLGNVVGANISNVLLIIGVAALVRPLRVRPELLRREVPILVAVTLLLLALLWDRTLSRIDGGVLVACSGAYLIAEIVMSRRGVRGPALGQLPVASRSTGTSVLLLVCGLAALLVGAWYLLGSSVVLAERVGMSQIAIGLTVVALGTSLPELATSVVAAIHGHDDVALGNAIGSSILNILLILGITALIQPIEIEALRPVDTMVLISSAIVLIPMLHSNRLISRVEGGLLVAGYVGYLASLAP